MIAVIALKTDSRANFDHRSTRMCGLAVKPKPARAAASARAASRGDIAPSSSPTISVSSAVWRMVPGGSITAAT